MIFLIVIFACLLNTILQSLIPIFQGEKSAKFLTSWNLDLARTRFDVSDGIRKRVIFELIFLAMFQLVFITLYFLPKDAFNSSDIHFVQDAVKATRIILVRPFWSDPLSLDQSLHPYVLELPILLLVIMMVASYKAIQFF